MSYDKREDGRKFDEIRPIKAKAGVVKNASGSAYFEIGKTRAYATVYGPREMFPRFKKNPQKGVLRCSYQMLPFSGVGERIRPGQNRRAKEISLVSGKALAEVVDLTAFPNAVVDVFIDIPDADAGTRCAGISAAAIALADAGIPMKEMVSGIAVGRVGETLVVDLDYSEDSNADTDMNVVMTETGKFIEVQGTAEGTPFQLDELQGMLDLAQGGIEQLITCQKQALGLEG